MGHAQQALDQADEGFLLIEDDGKPVCVDCIGDPALGLAVDRMGRIDRCGFCGTTGRNGTRLGALFSYMAGCLDTEYLDQSREFVFDPIEWDLGQWDSSQLLEVLEEPLAHQGLRDAFVEAFAQNWCFRDPFRLAPHERLILSWDAFARCVKEESRYLFLRSGWVRSAHSELIEPAAMLEELHLSIVNSDLIQPLAAGTELFRARQHRLDEELATPAQLGSPPRPAAGANRMSPAGIPMFYGAEDLDTALAELRLMAYPRRATVATWSTARELPYLDLVDVVVPSIFDATARRQRPWRRFLQRFAEEVARPVDPDSAGIDYVPTQIVTEFVRHEVVDADGAPVRGIRYRSAARPEGVSWVLFVDAAGCMEATPGWADDRGHWLGLDRASIRYFEPAWTEAQ